MTNHKTLESWHRRAVDTASGMTGRRARWHEKLSRFHLTVIHIAGADNVVADAMSRWAYPAGQGYGDISIHGGEEDDDAMNDIIAQENGPVAWSESIMSRTFWNRVSETAVRRRYAGN